MLDGSILRVKDRECLRHNWNCFALVLQPFQLMGPSEGNVYTIKATVEGHKKPAIVNKGDKPQALVRSTGIPSICSCYADGINPPNRKIRTF